MEKIERLEKTQTEKAEKMEKEKTKEKQNRVISFPRQKKDATKADNAQGITER